jgi:hypothetical protein
MSRIDDIQKMLPHYSGDYLRSVLVPELLSYLKGERARVVEELRAMSDETMPATEPGQCPTCGETRVHLAPEYLGSERYDGARAKLFAAFREYIRADDVEGDGRAFADWVSDEADDMTAWWRNRKQAGKPGGTNHE